MTKIPTLPTKLFVVKKAEEIWIRNPGLHWEKSGDFEYLGFMTGWNPDSKAYAKRQQTQLNWAYNSHKVIDGLVYTSARQVPGYTLTALQPEIWDNIPVTGFKVVNAVSRYSTSNKWWRIFDPRGVLFELSTEAFNELIQNNTVSNGNIIGYYVWSTHKGLKLLAHEKPL
jgi:hypothetical protein